MPVKKQSGVGFPTPGSYLVFKAMNCSLWTCSKSLMPYSIQFIKNYKFLLQTLLGPAFLLFFLSPTYDPKLLGTLDKFSQYSITMNHSTPMAVTRATPRWACKSTLGDLPARWGKCAFSFCRSLQLGWGGFLLRRSHVLKLHPCLSSRFPVFLEKLDKNWLGNDWDYRICWAIY